MLDPYASGVLHKQHHERLVAGIDGFARDAGIQPKWIWTRLADTCGPEEVEWVTKFRRHQADGESFGLCYLRKSPDAAPDVRMAAIAGALVRNFVRARVMTLGTVLDLLAAGEPVEATCLLIPNFFLAKNEGGTIAPWQVSALYDLLTHRGSMGLQTVISASSMVELGSEYGNAFSALVRNHYTVVEL